MKKKLLYIFYLFGVLFIIGGIVFNPSLVARYLTPDGILHRFNVDKILSFQLYAITFGSLVIAGAAFALHRRYLKILLFPLLIAYFLLVYNLYINKKYPENVLLKPSVLVKMRQFLLGEEGIVKDLKLIDYQPRSTLKVQNRRVMKAKYPAIDVHFHLGSMTDLTAEELVKAMDALGITKIVNVDGTPAGDFEKFKKDFKDKYPDRFIMFVWLLHPKLPEHLRDIDDPNFSQIQIELLENAVRMGARGLKIGKSLGLSLRDGSGKLVPIDDPRLDPIWAKVAELNLPVIMHTADPAPHFQPVDRFNESYLSLREHDPGSLRWGPPKTPSRETLFAQRENVLRKHPKTVLIGAHMGMSAEDLSYVSDLLEKYPNYYVDLAAVIYNLGRQPYTAREFFIKYQDRILFGTDGGFALGTDGWPAERYYGTYFEFLETGNEYFEPPLWDIENLKGWKIYGLHLPDEVLEKIYYKNAERLILKSSG
jgi:predicted TIM-barrel fold metal-dependent hydrolase